MKSFWYRHAGMLLRLLGAGLVVFTFVFFQTGCNEEDDDHCEAQRGLFYGEFIPADAIDNDLDGYTELEGDCNDHDWYIHPYAPEICNDMIDQDCDGKDAVCPDLNALDKDGDGFSRYDGDCNDYQESVHPGASEICGDGIDQNCDGKDPACSAMYQYADEPEDKAFGFSGITRDAETGEAVSGVRVHVYQDHSPLPKYTFTTDENGFFPLIPDEGAYEVVFEHPDYHRETAAIHIGNTPDTHFAEIPLVFLSSSIHGEISGMVTEKDAGKVIPQAEVVIRAGIHQTEGDAFLSVKTGADGMYSAILPPGNYTAQVRASGYGAGFINILCIPGAHTPEQNARVEEKEPDTGDNNCS